MPSISQSLIVNVEASYIETYFRTENLVRTGEESGQELKYWIDDLLEAGKINLEKFEDFLFNELFWGKRKTIQVYKLESIKDYKYSSDWHEALKDKYGIDTLEYSDILNCVPNRENPRKIAAVYVEENYRGELEKLRLLFACYIQIAGKDGVTDSISYIPVEIDFVKKIMVIKAWARQQIAYEDHKPGRLMSHIKNLMVLEFGVETRRYVLEHQKVLFEMSKKLIDRAYSCIPPYNELGKINAVVEHFKEEILKKLPLRNVSCDETGRTVLKEGVMNFEDEIKNVVESLTISDYFFDRDYDEIWKMGLEAVVSRIKFNDDERILTSLSGENTSAPIFCTKTFMSLKNRMNESGRTEILWITMDRSRGNLSLKLDATNSEYLGLLVKNNIRFSETDMEMALRIYEKYEAEFNQKTTDAFRIAVDQ